MAEARYLLRLDDVCPTADWAAWERLERLLVQHGVKPILAIVPDNRDPKLMVGGAAADFWDRVRAWQARGWTIGLHGYQHRYETRESGIVGLNEYSEFAGLPFEVQLGKLRAATDIFRSQAVTPEVFVAPAHSFDLGTLAALREVGIRRISDGFHFRVVLRHGAEWVPQQLWHFRPMPFGLWTVCVHPNTLTEPRFVALEIALRRFGAQIMAWQDLFSAGHDAGRWSPVDAAFDAAWRMLVRRRRAAAPIRGRLSR